MRKYWFDIINECWNSIEIKEQMNGGMVIGFME